MPLQMEEKDYRLMVKEVYARVESALDDVDPDLVETEQGQGTLTLITGRGKIILSMQPSVRQIWLAVAALGVALHFSYDASKKSWMDDKGEGKELFAFLKTTLQELLPQVQLNEF